MTTTVIFNKRFYDHFQEDGRFSLLLQALRRKGVNIVFFKNIRSSSIENLHYEYRKNKTFITFHNIPILCLFIKEDADLKNYIHFYKRGETDSIHFIDDLRTADNISVASQNQCLTQQIDYERFIERLSAINDSIPEVAPPPELISFNTKARTMVLAIMMFIAAGIGYADKIVPILFPSIHFVPWFGIMLSVLSTTLLGIALVSLSFMLIEAATQFIRFVFTKTSIKHDEEIPIEKNDLLNFIEDSIFKGFIKLNVPPSCVQNFRDGIRKRLQSDYAENIIKELNEILTIKNEEHRFERLARICNVFIVRVNETFTLPNTFPHKWVHENAFTYSFISSQLPQLIPISDNSVPGNKVGIKYVIVNHPKPFEFLKAPDLQSCEQIVLEKIYEAIYPSTPSTELSVAHQLSFFQPPRESKRGGPPAALGLGLNPLEEDSDEELSELEEDTLPDIELP